MTCSLEALPVEELEVSVSTNLSEVFAPRVVVRGRRYRERLMEDQLPLPGVHEPGSLRTLPPRSSVSRESAASKADIWDLILPLLQPPLIPGPETEPPIWTSRPHPYQYEGVRFLSSNEAALLGDDMGTGKTLQAAIAMWLLFRTRAIRSALVVCPVSVLHHWDNELQRWAGSLAVCPIRGTPDLRPALWNSRAHVHIVTYDTLRQDSLSSEGSPPREYDLVIADEIQKIKNPDTGTARSVKSLKAARRWGLSGTPIENRLEDLESIFDFLKPKLLPRSSLITPAAVRELIKPYFLRRRKEDVLKDLPHKQTHEAWVGLEPEQRAAYDEAEQTGVVHLKELGHKVTVQHVLALLQKLKQLCNVDMRSQESGKLQWLLESLEQMTSDGNKCVIFSQYLGSGVEWLYDKLKDLTPLTYKGGMSDTERARVLKTFEEGPEHRILLMTKAGALGIDLTAANYLVHFDHWWNPAISKQIEDRIHRLRQKRPVMVYHIWTEDTVEERIYKILERKGDLFDGIIEALSVGETGLTEEELFKIFGLDKPRPAPREDGGEMSPEQFEQLVAETFQIMGYGVRLTPRSHDRGIDIVATKPAPGGEEKIAIQCKHHKEKVGVEVAQRLAGVIAADRTFTKGIIVASTDFTRESRHFVDGHGQLGLITGDDLRRLRSHYKR